MKKKNKIFEIVSKLFKILDFFLHDFWTKIENFGFLKKSKKYFRSEKKYFFFEMKLSIDLGFFCALVPEPLLCSYTILEQVQQYKFSCESDLNCRIHTKNLENP